MAIQNVQFPVIPQKQSQMVKFGQLAQVSAPLVGVINPLAGAALGVGGGLIGMAEANKVTPPQPEPTSQIDAQSAVDRRIGVQNPQDYILEATVALDEIDLPDETKRMLRQPLLLASRGAV